ncbi:hypothetical protein HMPREF2946_04250 [Actinomyces sp. HMSC062G12]|nr:hypothetical protein HMPREF2946_04250 [Actinomyces sp. HMSC062G12]
MTIIERIGCAAARAQIAAMGRLGRAARDLRWRRTDDDTSRLGDPEEGATTVEYAIGTIAAAGFAGLLIVILKSDTVRAALESVIREALNTR